MPRAVLARTSRERLSWFDGFVRTYLERDLRDLSQVASLPDFRRLMGLAVHRVGQLLNQTEIGRDAGLSQATAHRYLNLLETTFQIYRLPAYSVNRSKRLIKSPKIFWRDTGLAAHLVGVNRKKGSVNELARGRTPRERGLVGDAHMDRDMYAKTHHFLLAHGRWRRVDFVIEKAGRLLPIEVKTSKRVRIAQLRHLELFLGDYEKRAPFGIVLHDTSHPYLLTQRVIALPVSAFL